MMRFWLDMGVDGFRVDAVPYLIEREGTSCENLPETHDVLRELRRRMDAEFPGRVLLAEANMWPEDVRPYFGDGDEFHMAFHFPLMPRMFMALRLEDRKPIVEIVERTPAIPESCQWGMFLRNHDELTLEMVTDVERDYMYEEYARDPRGAHQPRHPPPARAAARGRPPADRADERACCSRCPAAPILYYGDEIGMGDNVYLGDRNGVRTPMQWTGGWNAGFSRPIPSGSALPLISNPVYGYQAVNVESQRRHRELAAQLDAAADRGAQVDAASSAAARSSSSSRRTTACWPTCARYERETVLVVSQPVRHGAGRRARPARGWRARSRSRCSGAASSRGSAARPTS